MQPIFAPAAMGFSSVSVIATALVEAPRCVEGLALIAPGPRLLFLELLFRGDDFLSPSLFASGLSSWLEFALTFTRLL
jgi:hypothetical protein